MSAVDVRTVTGTVRSDELGLTLTHEHLANAMLEGGAQADPDFPDLLDQPVSAEIAWLLRERPYANKDNCVLDDDEAMTEELLAFKAIGGSTVLDVTPVGEGRSPLRLKELATRSGVQVIMGGGWYLERFHPTALAGMTAKEMAAEMGRQYDPATADDGILPGVVGEIGVSPSFTEQEAQALGAACIVQREHGLPLMIHLPGWKRYAQDVLKIVLDDYGVDPGAVVLCHMDPSGNDPDYQRRVADRGVWIEFDMLGMPFLYPYPGEGQSPSAAESAVAITGLIQRGHSSQLLMSHDLFLKAMLKKHGGNGLTYVPTLFADRLVREGVGQATVDSILTMNPRRLFESAAH